MIPLSSSVPVSSEAKKLELRPYQEEMVQKSLQGENDIILLPTGSGKTIIAVEIILKHIYSREAGNVLSFCDFFRHVLQVFARW